MNSTTKKSPVDFGTTPCFKFETDNPERMYWILSKKFKLEKTIHDPDGYEFSVPYGKANMYFAVTWDGIVFNLELRWRNGKALRRWVDQGDRDWLVRQLDTIAHVIHSLEHKALSSSSLAKSE